MSKCTRHSSYHSSIPRKKSPLRATHRCCVAEPISVVEHIGEGTFWVLECNGSRTVLLGVGGLG